MPTRRERISEANLQLVARLNLLRTLIGDLTNLSTTNTANLVAAINEVLGIAQGNSGGVTINDAVTNLTQTWSSSRISNEVATVVSNALEDEDLSDIAEDITALMQADQGLVSASNSQVFNATQQAQARSNIDAASGTEVGSTDYDFLSEINSNLTF